MAYSFGGGSFGAPNIGGTTFSTTQYAPFSVTGAINTLQQAGDVIGAASDVYGAVSNIVNPNTPMPSGGPYEGRTQPCPGQPSTDVIAKLLINISAEDLAALKTAYNVARPSATGGFETAVNYPDLIGIAAMGGNNCVIDSKNTGERNLNTLLFSLIQKYGANTSNVTVGAPTGGTSANPQTNSNTPSVSGAIGGVLNNIWGVITTTAQSAATGALQNAQTTSGAANTAAKTTAMGLNLTTIFFIVIVIVAIWFLLKRK